MTGEVSVEDQARAGGGLGVQGAAAGRRAILHIETEKQKNALSEIYFHRHFSSISRSNKPERETKLFPDRKKFGLVFRFEATNCNFSGSTTVKVTKLHFEINLQ